MCPGGDIMRVPRQAWLVARREVTVEIAARQTLASVGPYVAALVLLGGLAFGPAPAMLAVIAPGLVWLVVLVAAIPLAPSVAVAEQQDDAWDLLRGLTSPAALLAGKLAAVWLWLLAGWALATVLATGLLGAGPSGAGIAAGPIGTLGIATVTVLLGTLLPASSRRPALLAVLLLPATLPALIAGTQAATVGVASTPWLVLLVVFDVLTLTVTWAVAPALLEA